MIPTFDENGNLPPGIFRCSLDEIVARFGHGSPERFMETDELVEFVHWARQAGVLRVLVDGSYIISKTSPNDVDLVILPGTGTNLGGVGLQWPFLHIQIAADDADVEQWARVDFGSDRRSNSKGIAEIEL